jgi:hypothetical protein
VSLRRQHMADNLKFILSKLSKPADRREGLGIVKRLENARWADEIFDQVVHESGNFEISDGDLIFIGERNKLTASADLVDAYLALIDPKGE